MPDDEIEETYEVAAERRAVAYRGGRYDEADVVQKRSAADIAAWVAPPAAAAFGVAREYIRQRGETDRTRITEENETIRERIRHDAERPSEADSPD